MPRFRSFLVALLAVGVWMTQSPAFASTLQLRTTWDRQGLSSLTGWADGTNHGHWTSTYNGYGFNGIGRDGTRVLVEQPKTSLSPNVTHAGLVTSRASYGDTDLTVRLRTVRQLRLPTPNSWEVGWTLWHYTDDTHFYYLVLKPNGWELGKEDPAYPGAQRYLRTGSAPRFAVGTWHTMRIRQIGNAITVWGDGSRLASFTDRQRPYRSGHVGLYNEDSLVHFDTVSVSAP